MAYSEDVGKAGMIAAAAHVGAVDKAGAPYIEHPKRVAAWVSEPREKVVAWLHDVVEDTDVTLEEIEKEFGKETVEAVNAITHRKDEPWADYLCRVKANPVARAVKIADLIDNSKLYKNNVRKDCRSRMNVPFVTGDADKDAQFVKEAAKEGLVNIKGHRLVGGMRASIYNAMPIEGVQKLCAFMKKFEAENA